MKVDELKNIIKEEGNFKIISHKGIIGLILRPNQVHRMEECRDPFRKAINLTGYALIPADTPLGKKFISMGEHKIDDKIFVHGGITLFKVMDDVLWIGFDCAHAGDLVWIEEFARPTDIYRTKEYVEEQVRSLIEQLLRVEE